MKRWTPADPAAFRPLPWQRSPTRALLPSPGMIPPGTMRAALAAFVLVYVVIL